MKQYELEAIREDILKDFEDELEKACDKHPPYPSEHHAYGVMQEEVDEFFDEVRKQKPSKRKLRKELLHVAVTAIRAIRDLGLSQEHMLPKENYDE